MVEKSGSQLSVRRQCELLGLNRNRLGSADRQGLGSEDLEIARPIDELHLRFPEFGARRMSKWLEREGWEEASWRGSGVG
jgi:putative transposase